MSLREAVLSEDGTTLKITVKRVGSSAIVLAIFTMVSISIFIAFFLNAFRTPPVSYSAPIAAIFLAASAVVGYWMVAEIINRTEITIDEQWIVVRHLPLPWLGEKAKVSGLKQVSVEKVYDPEASPTTKFIVCAMTHQGKDLQLASFYAHDDVMFVEAKIAEFLELR